MKQIFKFIHNKKGSIAVMFALLFPIMMLAFFGMNNYSVYNQALQTVKGGAESAAQTFSKQFYSTCVADGNTLSNCSNNQGTIAATYTKMVKFSMEQSVLRVYPTDTPAVTIQNLVVSVNANYIEVSSTFLVSNITGLIMPTLTPGFDSVTYKTQTVINKHMGTI